MIHKGKQLEVVKFIQALQLEHKYPLLPVLRSYISAAALAGKMIRIRRDDQASQVHLCCTTVYCEHCLLKVVEALLIFEVIFAH
jgi:hypothetical protein